MNHIAIDLAQACQAFFIVATTATAGVNAVPPLRKPFVVYGARAVRTTTEANADVRRRQALQGPVDALLDLAAKLQVPHSWFLHFYALSVACSIFWAWQLVTKGMVFSFLVHQTTWNRNVSMTIHQIALTWSVFFLHGCRRLCESILFAKPSNAKMSLAPYVVGMAFYFFMGIAVWVEGLPALVHSGLKPGSIVFSMPSLKIFVAVPLAIFATFVQHDAHRYLSSLKKYTLPDRGLFKLVVCPHYTAECVFYLALAIMAAPNGMAFNRTVVAALVFSVINLCITAESTMVWYQQKFGKENVGQRWRMVRWVY